MKRRQTIKEWELELGIKVRNTKGFRGKRSKIYNNLYTKDAFRIGIQNCEISVKTDKGMKFLVGIAERDETWMSYIDHKNSQRNKDYYRSFRNHYERNRRKKV